MSVSFRRFRRNIWLKCIALVFMCFTAPLVFYLRANLDEAQVAPREVVVELEDEAIDKVATVDLHETISEGKCEVVHIAMVAADPGLIQMLLVEIKSILFYRQNPLHFHLMLDATSEKIISTIFKTWFLPEVNFSFYSLLDTFNAMKWLPNSHVSTKHALAKLMLVNVLPRSLKAVIVLDTDLMVASDIGQLWEFVSHIQGEKKMFGLVENQNDRHLDMRFAGEVPWPAAGHGYSSGVMLFNLELLRSTEWIKTWQPAAKIILRSHSSVQFSDEDVLNALIAKDKGTWLVLPCIWNVQLSANVSDYCSDSVHDFKIVQRNENRNSLYASHFQNMFQMVKDFDSVLFKSYISYCQTPAPNPIATEKEETADPCSERRREAKIIRRVHPYYLNYSYQSTSEIDVTLVTQTSMDRLHVLEALCRHWEGPLSIALYASDADLDLLMTHVLSSPVLMETRRLALHVVSKEGKFYPFNQLRNIAMDFVDTPYMYMIDVDIVPMRGLYQYAKEAVKFLGDSKKALLVPAFETFHYNLNFPENKSRLLSQLEEGTVFPCRIYAFKASHAPINYDFWKKAKHPYAVKWARGFEPYMITSSSVPRYDERFVGYGGDKSSQLMELIALGYELLVLPEVFMVHIPHPPSVEKIGFGKKTELTKCSRILLDEFDKELQTKYQ